MKRQSAESLAQICWFLYLFVYIVYVQYTILRNLHPSLSAAVQSTIKDYKQ